jgi:hypothetical protein
MVIMLVIIPKLGNCANDIVWKSNETSFLSISKKPSSYNNDVVIAWNRLFFKICQHTNGYRVTVAVRALAYMNWAAYESVVPSMAHYHSIAAQKKDIVLPSFDDTDNTHWALCVNEVYRKSLKHFFPKMDISQHQLVDSLSTFFEKKYVYDCDSITQFQSKSLGLAVTQSIIDYSAFDNGAFTYLDNKPYSYHINIPKGKGLWEPTSPDYLYALTPYWGKVRPILVDEKMITFRKPIDYSEDAKSEFYNQAYEVYKASNNITDEECWISEFWSDDIQFFTIDAGSRFAAIACQLLEEKNVNLEESLFLLTKLSIGLFDGSILCWKEKYYYNVLRPVTYIQANIEHEWLTNLNDRRKNGIKDMGITPAHPSYPSGHSVFSAVAATIFETYFGADFKFTDNTHKDRKDMKGTPRSFNNFDEMMIENAYSRISLGVHYRMDCDEGIRIGQLVGQQINQAKWIKSNN